MGIKELLKKNTSVYCLAKCLQRMRYDPEFVSDMIEGDPFAFKCKSYGPLNADENIFHIRAGRKGQGFFAEFRSIINYLIFADRFGFIPVVELSSDFEYYEKDGVNGVTNPFEYYFEQPTLLSLYEAKQSFNVFESNQDNLKYGEAYKKDFNGYAISEEYLNKTAEIIRKYIHFKPVIIGQFNDSSKDFPTLKSLVGVHVRGSDFKREYCGHPKLIGYDSYIELAKKMIEKHDLIGIFLATDDEGAVVAFREAFGENLYYYEDVKRTSGDKSVMYSTDKRKLHRFRLGFEVLRDVWSLSCCGALVAGISQVSICAQMFNRASEEEYVEKNIIDPGLSNSNRVFKNRE